MKQHLSAFGVLVVAAATLAGCTMKKQEAPELTGPSEFGTSIVVSITPDVLQQDGASQSSITITARDPNGQPVRNLPLRVEIRVGGEIVDFGSLSARSVVTNNDGRATLVYTAPAAPNPAVDFFTVVDIAVIPLGSDFNNSRTRVASVRLVPPGGVIPFDGLSPAFTFTPSAPVDHQQVLFDASTSQSSPNNPIVTYQWNFGDGTTGSNRTTTHAFSTPGTYLVQLTVIDGYGRSASTSQLVSVGAGVNPTATFAFSPTDPLPGVRVNFNASASRAAPGRTIVSYSWDFGDGTANASGVQVSHTYTALGTYTVTLVVTDDVGRTGVTSVSVPVQFPDAGVVAPAKKKGGIVPR